MTAPRTLLAPVLGIRKPKANQKLGEPSIADSGNRTSTAIARLMLEALDLLWDPEGPEGYRISPFEGQSAGTYLERGVAAHLVESLPSIAPARTFIVHHPGRHLHEFAQYTHLDDLQRLIEADETRTLSIAIGRDYMVKPDVTVAEDVGGLIPLLHASVSCKLTIRSDRAQNIRTEASVLTRHRRGRQPHIVAVTAEPLPTRLASLCRGTGDIDAVYHVALAELDQAVSEVGTIDQKDAMAEMVGQSRLLDFDQLAPTLAI